MAWTRSISARAACLIVAIAALAFLMVSGGAANAEESMPRNINTDQIEAVSQATKVSTALFDPSEVRGTVSVLDTDNGVITEFDSYDALIAGFQEDEKLLVVDGKQLTVTTTGANALAAVHVLAVFYANASYGGSTLLATTSISTFCDSHSYTGDLTGSWNDRVSSFKAFGGCRIRLYENSNQGGSSYGTLVQASSVGSLNNQASSYRVVD